MEDKEIVELYFQRNEDAIACTSSKYGRYLNKISFNILKDSMDAEECVNDTYMKAWNTIAKLLNYTPEIVSNVVGNVDLPAH